MNGEAEADEDLSPAQRAAAAHLGLLRQDPPAPDSALIRRVMHTSRWQQAVRAPLRIVIMIARAVLDGIGVAARHQRPRSGR